MSLLHVGNKGPSSLSIFLFLTYFLFLALMPLSHPLSLSLSLGPQHAPLPHGAVRPHAKAGLHPPGPDPVGPEGPEGLRGKGKDRNNVQYA